MKNLNEFNLEALNENELLKLQGGFFKEIGAAVGAVLDTVGKEIIKVVIKIVVPACPV